MGRALCLAPLAVVPGAFHRSTYSVFTSPKLVLVWGISVLLVVWWVLAFGARGMAWRWSWRWTSEGALVLLAIAVMMSAMTSPHSARAWTGAGVRWSGAVTYLAVCFIAFATGRLFRDRLPWSVPGVAMAGSIPVLGYAVLQAVDRDPFDWATSMSFGIDVMSTFGNPNFTSGYLAIVAPLACAVALRGGEGRALVRGISGAVLMSCLWCIGHLGSLQGQLALFATALVLLARLQDRRLTELSKWIGSLASAVLLLVVPIMAGRLGLAGLVGLSVVYALLISRNSFRPLEAVAGTADGAPTLHVPQKSGRRSMAYYVVPVVGFGVVGMVWGSGFIWSRFSTALGERWAFWRVALRIFADSPLTGLGLETFSTRFAELRDAGHASISPTHLTDSAHSVPLGLLAGGGILVSVAYLLLALSVIVLALRAWRSCSEDGRYLVAGLGAAWTAFHLQSAVSVDLPSLGILHGILIGSLFALGSGREEGNGKWMRLVDRWSDRPWKLRMGVMVPIGTVILVVLAGPLLAPVRADRAHHQAMISIARGEAAKAERHLLYAIDELPSDGLLWSRLARVQQAGGALEAAYRSSLRAVELRPGDPALALETARRAAALVSRPGYLDEAVDRYEAVHLVDPLGPHRSEVADFFEVIGRNKRATEIRGS